MVVVGRERGREGGTEVLWANRSKQFITFVNIFNGTPPTGQRGGAAAMVGGI